MPGRYPRAVETDSNPYPSRDDERGIEETLARFIFDELLELPYGGVDPLADEMVDSLGQEQLVEYIHEVYGIELSDEEMVKENFESLAALTAVVASKLASMRPSRAPGGRAQRSDP